MNPFIKVILIILAVVAIVWVMDTLITEYVINKFSGPGASH